MHATAATTLTGLITPALAASRSSLGAFPIVLLALACPLMMVFMMRSMGGMSHGGGGQAPRERSDGDVPDHAPDSWTRDQGQSPTAR